MYHEKLNEMYPDLVVYYKISEEDSKKNAYCNDRIKCWNYDKSCWEYQCVYNLIVKWETRLNNPQLFIKDKTDRTLGANKEMCDYFKIADECRDMFAGSGKMIRVWNHRKNCFEMRKVNNLKESWRRFQIKNQKKSKELEVHLPASLEVYT